MLLGTTFNSLLVLSFFTNSLKFIRFIATSPVDTSIVTCSDDHRARFWDDDNVKK